ncbi:uncharacterized protein [Littorina saxatilis]|uniref:uncharacterized protein n=2 Tax=Littorina saxatilis TaxID=31220 RepID=UPI0038B4BDBB
MTFCTRVYYVTHCSNKMATHSIYSSEEEEEYDGPRLSQAIVLPTSLNNGRKTRKEGHKTLLVTEPACRIGNTDWCQCGHCCRMPTSVECVCCHDVRQIKQKVEGLEEQVGCITAHPGFRTVCLDIYCLETAYYAYKQDYGRLNFDLHEKYRYVAYRQLVRWCWGFLGKSIRVPLPACAVKTIRDTFPDGGRVGFKLPQLDGIV